MYFAVLIVVYVSGFFVALFLEYPFRTFAKIMFSPKTRILRLNKELAQELNVETQYTEATEDELSRRSSYAPNLHESLRTNDDFHPSRFHNINSSMREEDGEDESAEN